jgi:hypothetical protein
MATVREFVRKTPAEAPGPAHPCNAPGLSPRAFLESIMHDHSLSLTTRIKAAALLLPLTESVPAPITSIHCKVIIEGISSEDPDGDNRNQQLFSVDRSNSSQPLPGAPGPSYIEKILSQMPLSEIIEIVSRCPEHLLPTCACGHKMFYPCSPPCTSRRSPLN